MPQVSRERERHNEYETHWEREGELLHEPQCIVHLSHHINDTVCAIWVHHHPPSELTKRLTRCQTVAGLLLAAAHRPEAPQSFMITDDEKSRHHLVLVRDACI